VYTTGNILSLLALLAWIPLAIWGAYRWPPAKGTAWLLIGAVLFLPETAYFKFPGLPHMKKLEIAVLGVLVGVLIFHRQRLRRVRLTRSVKFLISVLLGGIVMTVLLNSDPVVQGVAYVTGHRPYDAVHLVVRRTLTYVLPFVLGAAMFRGSQSLRVLFQVLVVAALSYSLLQIVEIRLSPQLHRWVYGAYQHDFFQTMRDGGYRPMVFMSHGLALAIFGVAALIAATALFKAKVKVVRANAAWSSGYLWLILVLGKSTAAILYSLVTAPLVLLSSPKTQVRVAVALALFVFIYPAARGADLIPVEGINDFITERYGEKKAASVMTRFINEAASLEVARERIFFGWGTYCRGCRFHPKRGHMLSIRDGDWINTITDFGLVGFFAKFGLLLLPVFILARQLKYVPRESDRRLLAALALIVATSVLDRIPNGNYNYLPLLFAGALYGSTLGIIQEAALLRRKKRALRLAESPDTRNARATV